MLEKLRAWFPQPSHALTTDMTFVLFLFFLYYVFLYYIGYVVRVLECSAVEKKVPPGDYKVKSSS